MFEYKVVVSTHSDATEQKINQLAADRWKVHTIETFRDENPRRSPRAVYEFVLTLQRALA